MDTETAPNVTLTPVRTRPTSFRLCGATGKNGQPCRMAALKGESLCRHHSEREQRTKAQAAADSINVAPLPVLVALDVTDASVLKRFRRGIMAHVARGTLGVQEARALLEVALSIHRDDHGNDQAQAFTTLASSIAAQLQPPGGGVNPRKGE